MEIQKINSTLNTEIGAKKESVNQPELSDWKPMLPTHPQKAVSDDCQLLARALPELQQIDDMDTTKMAEIRQSLRDGSFELDLTAISEAMLQQHI